jgi:hypothetical protein
MKAARLGRRSREQIGMAPYEGWTPVTAASERRVNVGRSAAGRLEAALIEQARLGDAYARSVSTSAEQSSYLRLQAASLEVSRCDRAVKAGPAGDG